MKRLAILAASSAFVLAACGGDETTNVTEVTESTGMDIIAKGEKMPACDKENAGKMIFVTDSSAVFYCANEKWATLNGKNGESGTSADAKNGSSCTAKEVKDGIEVSCGGEVVGMIKNGEDGEDLVAEYDTVTTAFLNQDMLKDGKYGVLVDKRDDKVYRTIEIGTQTWMAQNLDYSDAGVTSYCYDNKKENCDKYGRMYTWAGVNNLDEMYNYQYAATIETHQDSIIRYPNRGLCPEGWHVPSGDEWNELLTNMTLLNNEKYDGEILYKSIMSIVGWSISDKSLLGTDRHGFSAAPTGHLSGENGEFTGLNKVASWWTSSELEPSNDDYHYQAAARAAVKYPEPNVSRTTKTTVVYARPVRCIKD